jgi:hypothetical protein
MNAEITPFPNGPLKAERISALKNSRRETVDTSEEIFLCRCGSKPYWLPSMPNPDRPTIPEWTSALDAVIS